MKFTATPVAQTSKMKTTKELARELGLLRRRSIAGTSTRNSADNCRIKGQEFKYLIVIDFESTCWKEGKFRTQEIIEFPAVLLNTSTGEIESEFHHYVQPQEQPTLSEFCTELTGITQDKVDDGIPLNLCLRRFRYWLEQLHKEKGVLCTGTVAVKGKQEDCNTTCVTWSDWDLGVCLQYECKRKQILKPTELTSWIDLRATYRKFYLRKPNGLNGALQDLGINFQGREHSGVDDARNTAKLAYRLIHDGCQLKVTKTIKTHERSASCSPCIGTYFKAESAATHVAQTEFNEQPKNQTRKITPSKIPVPLSRSHVNTSINKTSCTNNKDLDQDQIKIPKSLHNSQVEINKIVCREVKASTPVKVKLSGKRKQITPLKVKSSDKAVNSPCRKVPRQFTPKKFSSKDIYVDGSSKTTEVKTGQQSKPKTGLQNHDTNIPQTEQYSTNTNKEKTNFKVPPTSITSQSVFKVPNPVSGKRIVNSTSLEVENTPCKNFCASTPINNNSKTKPFMSGNAVSPVHGFHQCSTSGTKTLNCINTPVNHGNSVNSSTCSNSSIGLKTPSSTLSNVTGQSTFFNRTSSTSMKMTPPLCRCGRRSKRKMVQSPGQNMGRFFFSCAVRKGAWSKEGCDFFKWEVAVGNQQNSSSRSVSSNLIKQYTPVSNRSNQNYSTTSQKRSLGIRPAFKTPVCIR